MQLVHLTELYQAYDPLERIKEGSPPEIAYQYDVQRFFTVREQHPEGCVLDWVIKSFNFEHPDRCHVKRAKLILLAHEICQLTGWN
jgi:hypothetical protein